MNNLKRQKKKPVYPKRANGLDPRPKAKRPGLLGNPAILRKRIVSVRTRGFVPPGLPGFTLDGRNLQSLVVARVVLPWKDKTGL